VGVAWVERAGSYLLAPEMGKKSCGLHNFPFSAWGRAYRLRLSALRRISATSCTVLRIGLVPSDCVAYAAKRVRGLCQNTGGCGRSRFERSRLRHGIWCGGFLLTGLLCRSPRRFR
jgi:hypothetical protein